MGFDPGFERSTCLATLKNSDGTKQSACGWQYIYIYIYVALSYRNCVITLVGSWCGQGIARADEKKNDFLSTLFVFPLSFFCQHHNRYQYIKTAILCQNGKKQTTKNKKQTMKPVLILFDQLFLVYLIYTHLLTHLPGLLAGPSGIRVGWGIKQWQIRGRKAPNYGWATFRWATFGWASCNLCPLCIALDFV